MGWHLRWIVHGGCHWMLVLRLSGLDPPFLECLVTRIPLLLWLLTSPMGTSQLLLSCSLHTQSIKQWLFFRNLWMRTEISSCSGSWICVLWRQRLSLAWFCAHMPNLAWFVGALYEGSGWYKWVQRSDLLNNCKGYFPCWYKVKISVGMDDGVLESVPTEISTLGLLHLHWIF